MIWIIWVYIYIYIFMLYIYIPIWLTLPGERRSHRSMASLAPRAAPRRAQRGAGATRRCAGFFHGENDGFSMGRMAISMGKIWKNDWGNHLWTKFMINLKNFGVDLRKNMFSKVVLNILICGILVIFSG